MAELDTNVETTVETEEVDTVETEPTTENPELAKLRAELAKQKAALDKATKEAAESKRALRARQTAEEAAAEEKKLADEERDRKLAEYEKRFTVAETSKSVMAFVGDEKTANEIATALYGAEDVDAAIAAFQKAWTAREKALRLEYGKIPAPGAGANDGPTITRAQLDAMKYPQRVEFKKKNPTEYEKLMGR